jgi:hypothetical protein
MNIKRMRGRTHRSGGSGQGGGGGPAPRHYNGNIPLNRNHVFDSSGPDLRVRGTAQQLFEKYLQLGRDATGAGDRVMAESYFQHAEHYFRILNAINQASQQSQPQQQQHYQNNNNPNPQNQNHTPQPNPGGHAGGQYNGHRRRNEEGYENDEQQGGYDRGLGGGPPPSSCLMNPAAEAVPQKPAPIPIAQTSRSTPNSR